MLLKSTVEQLKEQIQALKSDIGMLKENSQSGQPPSERLECVCVDHGVGVGCGDGGKGKRGTRRRRGGSGRSRINGNGNKEIASRHQTGTRGGMGGGIDVGTQARAEGGVYGESKTTPSKIQLVNCKKKLGHSTLNNISCHHECHKEDNTFVSI